MKKLWSKKWFKALVIFLPFTGIIHPAWYVSLFGLYFLIGGYYLVGLDE